MLKPCLVCGEPSDSTRCDEHRREIVRDRNQTRERRTNGTTWQKLSLRVRKLSPWCSVCGSTERLQADHLIPVSERPDLEFKVENLDVKCQAHNAARGNRVTDAERAEVEQRLAASRDRALRRVGRGPASTSPRTDGKPQRALHTPGGYPVEGGEAP